MEPAYTSRLPDIETGMTAIHIKFPSLTLKAGPRAFARIRENGLNAVDVGTLPGAAGGPRRWESRAGPGVVRRMAAGGAASAR
jgi:hypothetical protein